MIFNNQRTTNSFLNADISRASGLWKWKKSSYLGGPHSWVFSWLNKSGGDEVPKNQEIQEKATRLRPPYHSPFSIVLDYSNPISKNSGLLTSWL